MLQDRLLREGMANTMDSGGNIKYLFQFQIEKAVAKRTKEGFWEKEFWH